MEVVAVSHALPEEQNINGIRMKTSIIHNPLTLPSEYIEINADGVLGNATAAHDGPVYICLAENYDYWCTELGVNRSDWGWCHWGENITFKCTAKALTEVDFCIGDIWRIGTDVRLQVCGSRIPCMKLSWRCNQKDAWLKPLADSGRVGCYLRVLQGGRIHPGDSAVQEFASGDSINMAMITRLAYSQDLKTRDTLDLITNHKTLLRLNRIMLERKVIGFDDKLNKGKNGWKGWRDVQVDRIVHEGIGIKSFHLRPCDEGPLAWYQPGQFLTVRLPSGEERNWTISDWPGRREPDYYRITVKRAGAASVWMHDECALNAVLSIRSPVGRFTPDWAKEANFRQVYISAGIGITPIFAMMKSHHSHPNVKKSPGIWIHVARNGSEIVFQDELRALEDNPTTRVLFLTKPRASDVLGDTYDFAGRLDLESMKQLVGGTYQLNPFDAAEITLPAMLSNVYVCGPPEFEKDVKSHLQSIGIPPPFIQSENFHASTATVGDLYKARVKFTKSKKEAIWTKDKPMTLLELAESVGLTPDYGCRVGACGSCATSVVCGSVTGGFQMDGSVLACSALPASEDIEVEL